MTTKRMQQMIDMVTRLSPDGQDSVASAIRAPLQEAPVTSHTVRPEVLEAFEQVMANSTTVLEYLRDN